MITIILTVLTLGLIMEYALSESLFGVMRLADRMPLPAINGARTPIILPSPEHTRAMKRIRARTENDSDIEILHRFRALAKATNHFTDTGHRRQAKALLDNFAAIANAFGDACAAARELESKAHTSQRQKSLLNPVLAAIHTMSAELDSLQVCQGGLPSEKRLEILGRFTETRYGSGPIALRP